MVKPVSPSRGVSGWTPNECICKRAGMGKREGREGSRAVPLGGATKAREITSLGVNYLVRDNGREGAGAGRGRARTSPSSRRSSVTTDIPAPIVSRDPPRRFVRAWGNAPEPRREGPFSTQRVNIFPAESSQQDLMESRETLAHVSRIRSRIFIHGASLPRLADGNPSNPLADAETDARCDGRSTG